jgi:hypothetical protein
MPANTGKFLPVSVSVFGVPNTGIPNFRYRYIPDWKHYTSDDVADARLCSNAWQSTRVTLLCATLDTYDF